MGLHQINNIKNHQSRILDLCFIDDINHFTITQSKPLTLPEDPYHPSLLITFQQPISGSSNSKRVLKRRRNFRKLNVVLLKNSLKKLNWNSLLHQSSPVNSCVLEEMTKSFTSVINGLLQKTTPLCSVKDLDVPWFSSKLKTLRNYKTNLFRKLNKSFNSSLFFKYVKVRYEYKKLISISYQSYLVRMREKIRSNPKSFWSFVNNKRRSLNFPRFMKLDSTTSEDYQGISELFATYFKKSFDSFNSNQTLPYPYSIPSAIDFDLPIISEQDVLNELYKLTPNYFPGPDGIPSCVLKFCADDLYKPLTILFNYSLRLGFFPDVWKTSYVLPLHKNGCKSDISNYRPIAKLSSIPKLLEKLISNIISSRLNRLLSPHQHGFRKGKSTVTNLLEFNSFIFEGFKNRLHTDVIYTDFSKAFDKVNHNILLQKLVLWGFSSRFVSWMFSYLCGRTQRVIFNGFKSSYFYVPSGVPQGSHLGPLLFNVFINDLTTIFQHSSVLLFADDVKIFLSHSNCDHNLQSDLYRFYAWCTTNRMQLNLSKCKHVRYSRSMCSSSRFYVGNSNLETLDFITDLGVVMDRQLRFHIHIGTIVNRAFSVLGFVKRWSKEFNDPYVTKRLYTSLVRPILEYASVVWFPKYQVHIDSIESVQKQFLLFCLRGLNWDRHVRLPSYNSRLKLISLSSLSVRRKLNSSIFIVKLISGLVDSSLLTSKLFFNVPFRPSRSYNFLHVSYFKVNYLNNDPFRLACLEFNNIYNVINFTQPISTNKGIIEQFLIGDGS